VTLLYGGGISNSDRHMDGPLPTLLLGVTCPPVPSNIVPEFMLDSICRFAVI